MNSSKEIYNKTILKFLEEYYNDEKFNRNNKNNFNKKIEEIKNSIAKDFGRQFNLIINNKLNPKQNKLDKIFSYIESHEYLWKQLKM